MGDNRAGMLMTSEGKPALNIEVICEMILEGKSYREIAQIHGVGYGTIWRFCEKADHLAYTREALERSASIWDDQAEAVLRSVLTNATSAQVTAANNLAQHLRWRSAKRNPRAYGDKVDISTTTPNFAEMLGEARKRANEAKGKAPPPIDKWPV